jgi:hypothetical protein
MRFGATELELRACDLTTGKEVTTSIKWVAE